MAGLVTMILIVAWYASWVGLSVLVYPAPHLVALGAILSLRENLVSWFQDDEKLAAAVALIGFCATMVGHMYGTLAFIGAVELGVIGVALNELVFWGLIPIVLVERAIITAIITILGVPLVLALRNELIEPV